MTYSPNPHLMSTSSWGFLPPYSSNEETPLTLLPLGCRLMREMQNRTQNTMRTLHIANLNECSNERYLLFMVWCARSSSATCSSAAVVSMGIFRRLSSGRMASTAPSPSHLIPSTENPLFAAMARNRRIPLATCFVVLSVRLCPSMRSRGNRSPDRNGMPLTKKMSTSMFCSCCTTCCTNSVFSTGLAVLCLVVPFITTALGPQIASALAASCTVVLELVIPPLMVAITPDVGAYASFRCRSLAFSASLISRFEYFWRFEATVPTMVFSASSRLHP
mmetsp:Transcript_4543/g.7418  ORF Transcript_4543/g.7418 Transcript_4543/m.7418 type:complete len:276 (-) Transcript_4543:780-1607(-)